MSVVKKFLIYKFECYFLHFTGLAKALNIVIPKCSEMIRTDAEREVVMTALDAFNELLKQIGPAVLEGEGHRDAIINCVKDVLNRRVCRVI